MNNVYYRVYRLASGEVVVDCPSLVFQTMYQSLGEDMCPHPWRFRGDVQMGDIITAGNPDKEDYVSMEIVTPAQLEALAQEANEGGSAQFYYDESDELVHDDDWEHNVLDLGFIKLRHAKRLTSWIDEELALPTPDVIKIVGWQREQEKIKDLTDIEVYQLALDSLQYADAPKPVIQQKLEAKIAELQGG